jgi:hypothetical protein
MDNYSIFRDKLLLLGKHVLPNDKKLHDTIDQYATIKQNMKFLGEESKSFTMRELNKQIKKMLTPQMRLEYVKLGGDGGDTLNGKKGILAAI